MEQAILDGGLKTKKLVQLQFQMYEEAMTALKDLASKKGISPNILARLIIHEYFLPEAEDSKIVTVPVKNYRELQEYVETKKLGSIGVFAGFAMAQYITKYPLTESQKRQIGKNTD
jgi:hypothetical protein